MTAFDVLRAAYPQDIAENVCNSYREIEAHFTLGKWKTSELDAGHFVESVRRLLEFQFTGRYTAFQAPLAKFTEQSLRQYENSPGHESYRMLIPQALKTIYSVRNKRGVGHIGEISPNRMDSTFLLYSAKWILAEIIRLNSKLSINATETVLNSVIERQLEGLWKGTGIKRVLNTNLDTRGQILVLLYDESPSSAEQLRDFVGYKNKTAFRSILKDLHKRKLVEVRPDDLCYLLPPGLHSAEKLILASSK